jgi:hypothetical protein
MIPFITSPYSETKEPRKNNLSKSALPSWG